MARYLRLLAMCLTLAACAAQQQVPSAQAVAAVPVAEPVRIHWTGTIGLDLPIEIDNPYGDVRLRFGGYEHRVEVQAIAQVPEGAAAFELLPSVAGLMQINPRLPTGAMLAATQRIDIVVYIPKAHAVQVRTVRGLVEARGVQSDVRIRSEAGDFQLRGISGVLDAQTEQGSIEVAMDDPAPGSAQRLVTGTGTIVASFSTKANAQLNLATSGLIATEYSVEITPQPGAEPNKRGLVRLGASTAIIEISSKRGELRLYRRAEFVNAG